jgi:hypothetical protein
MRTLLMWLAGEDCVLWLTLKAGTVSAVVFRWVVEREAETIGMAGGLGATAKRLLAEMFGLRMLCYSLRFPCCLKNKQKSS